MLLGNIQNLARQLQSKAASCQQRRLLWRHTERRASAHKAHRYTRPHSYTLLSARKDVWRERTPAIPSPILPGSSGCPTANLLSTTSHAEKQMSACHFSWNLTLKCFRPFLKVERLTCLLWGVSSLLCSLLLLVLSHKSLGQIAHIRHDYCNSLSPFLPGGNFSAPLWASGSSNTPQGHFRAIDLLLHGESSGSVLLGAYGFCRESH